GQYLAFRLLRNLGLTSTLQRLLRSWSPHGVASGQFRRAELEYQLTAEYTKAMAAPMKYAVTAMLRHRRSSIEWRQSISAQLHACATRLGVSPISQWAPSSVALMA